jgi:hypothetical protein
MGIYTTLCEGRRLGGRRRLRTMFGLVALVLVSLVVAAPALATIPSATATLAPIGTGSYLLTVTNTGSEPLTGFVVSAGEEPVPTNIVPTACQFSGSPFSAAINCTIPLALGASAQMCYTGHALVEVIPGSSVLLLAAGGGGYASIGTSAAVASCPLPGFNPGSGSTPGTGSTPGPTTTPVTNGTPVKSTTPATGKGGSAFTHTQCKAAYRAWGKKHHHATRSQKKAESNKLHKTHGCSLSILK